MNSHLSSYLGILDHHFFKRFSDTLFLSSLSGTSVIPMLVYLIVSHMSFRLYVFILFSLCSSDTIISFIFLIWWLCLLPVYICCWAPLINFSFQFLFFSVQISDWFLCIISTSLFIFSFSSYFIFLISFGSLFVFSFNSLNLFKIDQYWLGNQELSYYSIRWWGV